MVTKLLDKQNLNPNLGEVLCFSHSQYDGDGTWRDQIHCIYDSTWRRRRR